MKHFKWAMLALPVFLISAFGQDQLPPGPGPAMQRVEAYKKIKLMEVLKLDEQTAIKFFSRYNTHSESIRELNQRRNALVDQLQAMGRTKAGDAEIEKVIKQLINSESELLDVRTKFFTELKEVLSIKQIAEFIVFERNFNQNIREMLRDLAREREGKFGRPQ
ncbi:MAG: hypothetical protein HY966_05460 [Ignavibacteriales bacterium]|nr:hypothetical protein [Ignavibacteriales bacterium]